MKTTQEYQVKVETWDRNGHTVGTGVVTVAARGGTETDRRLKAFEVAEKWAHEHELFHGAPGGVILGWSLGVVGEAA